MKASRDRANEARYDQETDVIIGPPSKLLKIDDVAKSPFLTMLPLKPKYPQYLSASSFDRLAKMCSVEDVKVEVRESIQDDQKIQLLRKRLLGWAEKGQDRSDGRSTEPERKSKRAKRSAIGEDEDALEVVDQVVPDAFKIYHHPEYANLYYKRDGLLEQHILMPTAVSNEQKSSIEFERGTEGEVHPMVVTISVYSRAVRGLWAKEKVKETLQRLGTPDDDEVDSHSEDVADTPENEDGQIREGKAERGFYSNLQLSQEMEMLSTQSLLDLRRAIRCKIDSMPQMRHAQSDNKSLPGFSKAKRKTDCCFMIENVLYSEDASTDTSKCYANLLAEHLPSTASQVQMANVSIGSISLRTGKLYWYLHQGNCEHVWSIKSIRALRSEDERRDLSSPKSIFRTLATNIEPLAKFSRGKVPASRMQQLDTCDFCRKRPGEMLIIGGSRVNIEETKIKGLKQDVTITCNICWTALTGGVSNLDQLQGAHRDWTVIPTFDSSKCQQEKDT